jgi:hypothetical protein
MDDFEKIKRLIEKGHGVLRTHKPNPPEVIGFPTLDSGAFSAWQSQCLSFLEAKLSSNSPYVRAFQEKVKRGHTRQVKAGIGILVHSLLHLYFDDIRPEEWTPSYAGKTSRMDFLLKQEQIVVEVKKTRKGLDAKELGSQLIEDMARYQAHPDCDSLICFVYDPDGRISNPRGIENDLRRPEGDLRVEVLIRP